MPSVASDPSVLLPPQHNPGARVRAAESGPAEPSLFAAMVEPADRPPPPEHDTSRPSAADASGRQTRTPEKPSTDEAASSPVASDAAATDRAEASGDAAGVEAVDDAAQLLEALGSTAGNGPVAPMPSAATVPVSVETVLVAQGGFEAIGGIDAATASGPAPQAAPPELTASGDPGLKGSVTTPGSQSAAEDPGAPSQAQAGSAAGEADVPVESMPIDKNPATIATSGSTVDVRAPEPRTPTGSQPVSSGDVITAQAEATPVETGKRQPTTQAPPAETGEPPAKAATVDNGQPTDDAEPTERSVHRHQGPHEHADGSKLDDLQTLGEQVSDAARNSKPASEAVHAALLANDRAVGMVAHAASPAARTTWEPAVPIAGLAIEIAARAQAGQSRFEIRLDPPELGRIDVRLDIDRSGQVTSRLVVERAETLEQLRRDAAGLERALQDAGLKTSQNGLQFSLRDQGFAGRDNGNASPETARLVVPDPDLAPVEALVSGYGRLLRTGGIDIRV